MPGHYSSANLEGKLLPCPLVPRPRGGAGGSPAPRSRIFLSIAGGLCLALTLGIVATPITAEAVTAIEPTGDKYMYPFIDDSPTGGKRTYGSVFGAYGDIDDPLFDFDDRDAQFFLDFNTGALAPAGQGAENYRVVSLTLTLVVENEGGFFYDPTFDPLETYLNPTTDTDPGRPLELYGVGYRSGWTRSTFTADSPFQTVLSTFGQPNWNRKRNAFAIDFDSNGLARDVSNNVEEQFEVNPWAVADSPGFIDLDGNYVESAIAPGSLMPEGRVLRFQVDPTNPFIAAYLQDGLNAGRLHLMVSSLYDTEQESPAIPRFYSMDIGFPELVPQLEAVVLLMPRPAIEKVQGGFRIAFNTVVGQAYQIEYRDSLTSGNWQPLGGILQGNGGLRDFIDPSASGLPSRFYRVSVSKSP
jgi:hypothetical protein